MKYILLFFVFFASGHCLKADEQIRKKIKFSNFPTPLPVWETDQLTLPLKRIGNLILLEVRLDTLVGNLILDTGAPHLVLNKTYFREYPHFGEILAGGVTGATGSGNQTQVKKLEIGNGLSFRKIDADVIPLGHLESRIKTKILGLLGINLLFRLEAKIDLRNNILTLNKTGRSGLPIISGNEDYSSAVRIPVSLENGMLMAQGFISGRRLQFCLDTGAETNILHAELSNKILDEVRLIGRKSLTGTGLNRAEVVSGIINQIRFSQKDFGEQAVIIANLDNMSMAYGIQIDGMIGMDFLNNHVILINLQKEELWLW